MENTFHAACVQNDASANITENLSRSEELVRECAAAGADLITLPEFFSCLDIQKEGLITKPHSEKSHPALKHFQPLADELSKWILLGSITVKAEKGLFYNCSYMLNASGKIIARYPKIHLFDVNLGKNNSYRESRQVKPGDKITVASTPWGKLGMTICYDIRFPHLYRTLAQSGAEILTIPAAFTKKTGEAHWHILNRARAIECGAFVISACMPGIHGKGKTFGHSLIVNPWGEILADGGSEEGFIVAKINLDEVSRARNMIPALRHDRPFNVEKVLTVAAE